MISLSIPISIESSEILTIKIINLKSKLLNNSSELFASLLKNASLKEDNYLNKLSVASWDKYPSL